MNNIRISLDLLKFSGSRLLKANDANGVPTTYVAVPINHFYVPNQSPRPFLLLSEIAAPNAQYGDYMIKPYMSADEYRRLSDKERGEIPIIGKGTFMQAQPNKQVARQATAVEAVDVAPGSLDPTRATQPSSGSAAQLPSAPSPAEGGQSSAQQIAQEFVIVSEGVQIASADSWLNAVRFAEEELSTRDIIELWRGGKMVNRWRWDTARIDWIQLV